MTKQPADDGYTDAEIERRAADMVRRSFAMPYKPHRELVGKTERAKAAQRTKLKRAVEKAQKATETP